MTPDEREDEAVALLRELRTAKRRNGKGGRARLLSGIWNRIDRFLDDPELAPSWMEEPIPDTKLYVESEVFVAGALATMPPFSGFHPQYALPYARHALYALGEWEPSDG
jgi:hypothetical protein